jgi:hypothetical protein
LTTITNHWIALEVPHMLEPRVYTGSGKEMYLSGTYQAAERRSGVVYECTTARELASGYGLTINDDAEAFADADATWVAEAGNTHGWDTPLYRADYALGEGEYRTEPVDEIEAAEAYNGHDLSFYRLITSAEECRELLDYLTGKQAPRIGKCGPVRAAAILRREAEQIGWIEAITDEDEDE